MLVTKHAAELCALLVGDLYGELPSRLVAALLTKGRSNLVQLGHYTSLAPKQIRHGLGVLLQHNLIYHGTLYELPPVYEANPGACYSLIRSGKILKVIESRYGIAERDVVQFVLLSGHARIADVLRAFKHRSAGTNGLTNGSHKTPVGDASSGKDVSAVLKRLIQSGIIEKVLPRSFRNPTDMYREFESNVLPTGGKGSAKEKAEKVLEAKRKYKEFRDDRKSLKRQLDRGFELNKRLKLQNGHAQVNKHDEEEADSELKLDLSTVIRVDHERCNVELRNQHLANFAANCLGDVTGEIYRTMLNMLTAELSSCRIEPILTDITSPPELSVTTMAIFDHLGADVDVGSGIGKVPGDKVDFQSAEKIRKVAPKGSVFGIDCEDSDTDTQDPAKLSSVLDEDGENSDDSDESAPTLHHHQVANTNGDRHVKVTFEDEAGPPDSRMEQMRKHLLVLAESKYRFVRHCGIEGRGRWTVDFDRLLERLRAAEVDAFIEQSFGRQGLRLTRMLREKGKVEEKNLTLTVHMTMTHIQEKFLALQMAGLVDVQEVPKDSTRTANRTLFFWYFDGDRTEAQLLNDVYKGMVRCLQVLQVERHKERNILSFVERKDVQGQEEEVMTTEHYNKYNRHLELQNKLLGQVMRLDDVVGVLRDF